MSYSYDVIIVGCGPVGAVAGHLLGHRGISTLVLERDLEPYDVPRAIHIDHEVMRIFQSAGLAERLLPLMCMPLGVMHFGADLDVIRPLQRIVLGGRLGWNSDYFFYQPDLEAALRAELAKRPSVDIRLGHSVANVRENGEVVDIEAIGPGGALFRAHANYLLGADGAKSLVRESLNSDLEDLDFEEPWIVVDALVDGALAMPDLKGVPPDVDLQRIMFTIGDPRRPVSVMPGVGRHRRWEFMLRPGETAEHFAEPGAVKELLAPWLGGSQCEVMRSAVYRFHALLAKRWQSNRVFLVGDSAHQTPPFFGQGLCHGIRDAANLCWKLELVLKRGVHPVVLASYGGERMPQVKTVIEASIRTGRYICTLDPAAAKKRDMEMRSAAFRPGPAHADIIPPISAGLISQKRRAGVGVRFIQPRVANHAGETGLLDDMTQGGFVVLCGEQQAPGLMAYHSEIVSRLGIRSFLVAPAHVPPGTTDDVLVDSSGELRSWFDQHQCVGVVVRPDAYVYGVFSRAEELDALLDGLAVQFKASESVVRAPETPHVR